ncbi:linker for activation of T-cells family member 2 isoform X1 [Myotis myotis]|uniref:linker for activation of T-cells family member 2 isoform X1 n=1 Tax=Myotis myotis TaxID=51298 RepID=UPI00174B4857|nr:linker for activation of T-cells family member 2 isoform X1 [Myotis myotis]XP_036166212.1 linker for activation of T-cells family member 2 isoform X1 [Myotis myotis]
MSAETELLWPGVALLLLLGAVASLCVRCSRSGAKRPEKIYEQRNLQENQQSFAVTGTYSLARPLMDTASDLAPTRKDKLLQFSPSLEDSASPRYLNFSKGSRHGSDASYIDPIMEYFNWERSQKQQEGEAERKEGHREETHGGIEAFGRTWRRSLSLGLDRLGSEGQMRELAPRAGAQVQRREEMCGSQGWATGASKRGIAGSLVIQVPSRAGHIWGLRGRPRMGQTG